ncbi:hypothetical protein FQR65_LT17169 [Abscondita terminalis]|nr:hypothetical protein FQR65_LT17169 [Abscondita terminalis]
MSRWRYKGVAERCASEDGEIGRARAEWGGDGGEEGLWRQPEQGMVDGMVLLQWGGDGRRVAHIGGGWEGTADNDLLELGTVHDIPTASVARMIKSEGKSQNDLTTDDLEDLWLTHLKQKDDDLYIRYITKSPRKLIQTDNLQTTEEKWNKRKKTRKTTHLRQNIWKIKNKK